MSILCKNVRIEESLQSSHVREPSLVVKYPHVGSIDVFITLILGVNYNNYFSEQETLESESPIRNIAETKWVNELHLYINTQKRDVASGTKTSLNIEHWTHCESHVAKFTTSSASWIKICIPILRRRKANEQDNNYSY